MDHRDLNDLCLADLRMRPATDLQSTTPTLAIQSLLRQLTITGTGENSVGTAADADEHRAASSQLARLTRLHLMDVDLSANAARRLVLEALPARPSLARLALYTMPQSAHTVFGAGGPNWRACAAGAEANHAVAACC